MEDHATTIISSVKKSLIKSKLRKDSISKMNKNKTLLVFNRIENRQGPYYIRSFTLEFQKATSIFLFLNGYLHSIFRQQILN